MFKNIGKKIISTVCMIGAAFLLSNAIGSLKTMAAEISIKSMGNIIMRQEAEDGSVTQPVAIYSDDITYLKNEISDLRAQL